MKAMLFGGKVHNKNINRKTNLNHVGLNSGNLLFWYALTKVLDVELHTGAECARSEVDLNRYSSFITTDLIWLQQNMEYPHVRQQLKMAGDRPLVPISVGLQNSSVNAKFEMHKETVKLLDEIQERCILGVRGEYTADVLNKNGVKNIKIIGCPSMYLPFDYQFRIRKKELAAAAPVCVNMRSMWSELKPEEIAFLRYSADNEFDFCEQTSHPFSTKICKDLPTFEHLNTWMNQHKMMFFDVDDWRSFMSEHDFSMGGRFHGNVIGLWEGVPALFITVDSRTTEMCRHFSLPTMSMQDFDPEKDIRYYYEKADYSEFNQNYANRLDEYITFLKRNNLPIAKRIDGWYDRRLGKTESASDTLSDKMKSIFKNV